MKLALSSFRRGRVLLSEREWEMNPAKAEQNKRVIACTEWIIRYVGEFTHPDSEVTRAAEKVGFLFREIKIAKQRLRGQRKLSYAVRGGARGAFTPVWWCWVGERGNPKPDRPEPTKSGA
jgi:hypothetical protein